jgi:hypothetical protein
MHVLNLLNFRLVCCGPAVYAYINECSFYIHALMSPTLFAYVTAQYIYISNYILQVRDWNE